MRTCEMQDCHEKHVAKGLCDRHRKEAHRLGVQGSVQGLTAALAKVQGVGSYTGKGFADSVNKPWEADLHAHVIFLVCSKGFPRPV